MSPQSRPQPAAAPSFVADFGRHGARKRTPDGRKLTGEELACLPLLAEINEGVRTAAARVAEAARCPDTGWVVAQFLDPVLLCRRKKVALPDHDLMMRAVARLEDIHEGTDPTDSRADWREVPRRKLVAALEDWGSAYEARARDPRWKRIAGRPVTLEQYRSWRESIRAAQLTVIPRIEVPGQFERALIQVMEWDEVLARRGHAGEQFSLREEMARLNNWPGDQWFDGDDYASAQKRFHRRLKKARRMADDEIRDRIMQRALYLREGLLLDPVNPLEWFLAVCRFRWEVPELLDIRPELLSWRVADWVTHLGSEAAPPERPGSVPPSVARATRPTDVPPEFLRAVTGPKVMIDLDEDVVTALPPGCRVRRLIMSAEGPLGPDWTVYWVDSEWEDSRPILDLVESAKLHPKVVFVSDGHPSKLAERVRPFLDRAFEIPTNPLTAHSHIQGVWPTFDAERLDAGL